MSTDFNNWDGKGWEGKGQARFVGEQTEDKATWTFRKSSPSFPEEEGIQNTEKADGRGTSHIACPYPFQKKDLALHNEPQNKNILFCRISHRMCHVQNQMFFWLSKIIFKNNYLFTLKCRCLLFLMVETEVTFDFWKVRQIRELY